MPVEGLADSARQLLPIVEDTQLKTGIIATIIRQGDSRPLSADLLDSNVFDVRSKVIEFRRSQGDESLTGQLLDRLRGGDDFYVSLVGRMPLSRADLARLQRRLNSSEGERQQIACVLAMQGEAGVVAALLKDKHWTIRGEAVACAPFNRSAEAILKATPRAFDGFRSMAMRRWSSRFAASGCSSGALQRLPLDQGLWRLSILDQTPSGFGLWGRGMRDWIDERIFQLRFVGHQAPKRPTLELNCEWAD